MKIPIRLKLVLLFSFIILLISVFNYNYYPQAHKTQALKSIQNHVHNMAEVVALSTGISLKLLDFESIRVAIEWAKQDPRLAYLGIFDTNKQKIAVFDPKKLNLHVEALLTRKGHFEQDRSMLLSVPIEYQGTPHGTLLVALSLEDMYRSIEENKTFTLYICFAIFIIGSVLSLIFSNIITRPIQQLTEAATEVSKGNTSVKINITTKDEIGYLATCFKRMVANIKKSIEKQVGGIFKSANSLYKSSQNISTTVKDQSIIMNQQSERIVDITATLKQLSVSASQVAESSSSVSHIAETNLVQSEKGMEIIQSIQDNMDKITRESNQSVESVIELGKKSKEVGKVMEIINHIADQTKLIAFNAAIEASAAGEEGKRFGVVAVEIRRLADSVMDSTAEIHAIVEEIQHGVNQLILASENEAKHIRTGAELTHQAHEHLNSLLSGAESTNEAMKQISQATLQEKTATSQVFTALKEIQQGIQQSTQALKQTTLVTTELTVLADELNQMVTELQGENETDDKPQV